MNPCALISSRSRLPISLPTSCFPPKGQLNLKDIVRQDNEKEPSAKTASVAPSTAATENRFRRAAPATATNSSPPATGKPLPVRIGRVVMQGGNVNFNDQFIKPNYRANLTGLAGRVGPAGSKKTRRNRYSRSGGQNRTAENCWQGRYDGQANFTSTSLRSAKGIDMPTFSPYSGKYVGYAIEKGKLSVDIHYHVEKGELTAENNVFLDQLTLGEKVESPDALSIPVNLALALLKNRRWRNRCPFADQRFHQRSAIQHRRTDCQGHP